MVLSSYSSYTAGNQEKQPRRPLSLTGWAAAMAAILFVHFLNCDKTL